MTTLNFCWTDFPLDDGGTERRPVMLARIVHGNRETPPMELTLGTASSACVLHADIAKWLGIALVEEEATDLGPMLNGLTIRGYPGRVEFRCEDASLELDVLFSENMATAGVLGWSELLKHAEVEVRSEAVARR